MKTGLIAMLWLSALCAMAEQPAFTILKSQVPSYSVSNATLQEAVAMINQKVDAFSAEHETPFVHIATALTNCDLRISFSANNCTVGELLRLAAQLVSGNVSVSSKCVTLSEDRREGDVAYYQSTETIGPRAQRELGLAPFSRQAAIESAFNRFDVVITNDDFIVPLSDLTLTPTTTNNLKVLVSLASRRSFERVRGILRLIEDGFRIEKEIPNKAPEDTARKLAEIRPGKIAVYGHGSMPEEFGVTDQIEFRKLNSSPSDYMEAIRGKTGGGAITYVNVPHTMYSFILVFGRVQPLILERGTWEVWEVTGLGKYFSKCYSISPGEKQMVFGHVEGTADVWPEWHFDFGDKESGLRVSFTCDGGW